MATTSPLSGRALAASVATREAVAPDSRADLSRRLRATGRAQWAALWLPLVIVALAFALRVVDLAGVPYGFFCDEASNGLDAWYIGHTLHDQHGAFLPVFFQAFGDWRGGFHIYVEVPFLLLFGVSEFAVRLGSAVEGTLTVLLTYLFVTRAVNRPVGLLSAFFLAIAPWHIINSRVGFEFSSLPFALALCLTLLFYSLDHPRLLPWGLFMGTLGIYTYQPARLFFPLILLVWCLVYMRRLWAHRRLTLIGIAASALALVPSLLAIRDGIFFARLGEVTAPAGTLGAQLGAFAGNYLAHLAPAFLFTYVPELIVRHNVQGYGMLYGALAPFLVLGVIVMAARLRRSDLFFLGWVLVYPVSVALVAGPRSSRSIAGVIVAQVVIAQGAYAAWLGLSWLLARLHASPGLTRAATRAVTVVAVLGALGLTTGFMRTYLVEYPRYASGPWGWQAGPRQIVARFVAARRHYDRFLWSPGLMNYPDELLRFYTIYDPSSCTTCAFIDVTDRAAVQAAYAVHDRVLWAAPPDAFASSALSRLPHRVVGHVAYPDGTIAYLYIATGSTRQLY